MEAQIPRQHGQSGDELQPTFGAVPPAIQGEDHGDHAQDQGKKSVFKNVREKAKKKAQKIKQTLTKQGHSNEDEHDHDRDQHSYEEDDEDDDEQLVEHPEVHGAPKYDSAAVGSGIGSGQQQHGTNLEKPTAMEEDRLNIITDPPTRPFSQADHENSEFGKLERAHDDGHTGGNLGIPSGLSGHVEQHHSQPSGILGHTQDENIGHDNGVKIGGPTTMEHDSQASTGRHEPSNYQSKVTDPTAAGGAEAGITPILHSFDKMSVHDEPHSQRTPDNTPKMSTGSHGQLSPDLTTEKFPADPIDTPSSTGSHDQFSPVPIPEDRPVNPSDPGSPLKSLVDSRETQGGYTAKISSATSALTGKAVAAKNIVASKLGYGEKEGTHNQLSTDDPTQENLPADPIDNPSKMFTGSHDRGVPEDKPVDTKDLGATQGGYTGKISSATSAITERAVAAKNIVASKLGYGGKEGSEVANTGGGDQTSGNTVPSNLGYGEKEGSGVTNTGGGQQTGGGVTATVTNYAQKAAATVSGTLAPVTDRVANVGGSVLSKVQGGATNKQSEENKEPSKGVTTYLAEKLRPSEEHKALSDVISDKLYRKKPEAEEKPVGKVTMSDELARELGTKKEDPGRETEGVRAESTATSPAVVERVKGWFGIGQSQTPQGHTNDGAEHVPSSVDSGEERRLQESTN